MEPTLLLHLAVVLAADARLRNNTTLFESPEHGRTDGEEEGLGEGGREKSGPGVRFGAPGRVALDVQMRLLPTRGAWQGVVRPAVAQ